MPVISGVFVDLRHAIRHLRRSPGFALAAILTLAFGIGANTAMLTMLNALLFRPLKIRDPAGLVGVMSRTDRGQARQTLIPVVERLTSGPSPLTDVCGYNGGVVLGLEANGVTTQATGALVT